MTRRQRELCDYPTRVRRHDDEGAVLAVSYLTCTLPVGDHTRHEHWQGKKRVAWWPPGFDFELHPEGVTRG
jgi:hypothetical protein